MKPSVLSVSRVDDRRSAKFWAWMMILLAGGTLVAQAAALRTVLTVVSGDFAGDSTVGSVRLTEFPLGNPITNEPIYLAISAGGGRANTGYRAFTTDGSGLAQFVHARLGRRVGPRYEYYETANVVAQYNFDSSGRPTNPNYVGDAETQGIPLAAPGQKPVALIRPPTVEGKSVAWDSVPPLAAVRFVSDSHDPDNSGTTNGNPGIEHWYWRVTQPDGQQSSPDGGGALVFKPTQLGIHTLRLVVWDNEGETAWTEHSFTVLAPRLRIEEVGTFPAVMNVGEGIELRAVLENATATEYRWQVSGPILRDYDESTQVPGARFTTVAMAPEDFQRERIGFYWKPVPEQFHPRNSGPVQRRVDLRVMTDLGPVEAVFEKSVERNNADEGRQPVDIYTRNPFHLLKKYGATIPLAEHNAYHQGVLKDFGFGATGSWIPWRFSGTSFFQFHREFIEKYEGWRDEFGYEKNVPAWDTGTALPTDFEAVDSTFRRYAVYSRPTWFSIAGGAAARPNRLWDDQLFPLCNGDGGEKRLADFASLDDLGCAMVNPWHATIHARVGGTMGPINTSPHTEIFWRFHKFLNQVADEFTSLKPPLVVRTFPPEYQRFLVGTPRAVSVEMSQPVAGLAPGDLTVNGSAATALEGSGTGPFVFSGFAPPPPGEIVINFAPSIAEGASSRLRADAPLPHSWTHRLLVAEADEDGDGLSNADELDRLLDPTAADSDGDGFSDAREITEGEDPHVAEARLFLSRADESTVTVRWPLLNIPAQLERSEALNGSWVALTNQPLLSLTGSSLTLPVGLGPQFFQLRLDRGHDHGFGPQDGLPPSALGPEPYCGEKGPQSRFQN